MNPIIRSTRLSRNIVDLGPSAAAFEARPVESLHFNSDRIRKIRYVVHRLGVRKNKVSSTSISLLMNRATRRILCRIQKRGISSAAFKPVVKGDVSPMLIVDPIRDKVTLPDHARSGMPGESPNFIKIYSDEDIPKLRKAARLARKMLEFANSLAKPGVTTDDIDVLTHHEIIRNGAYPTPLNYYGFPKSICTSVNEVVCHGIPDSRVLCDGDILSIDVSLFTEDGYHGDNCGSVIVGMSDNDVSLSHLVETTKTAVDNAIAVCQPGACFSHIGAVIDEFAHSEVRNERGV